MKKSFHAAQKARRVSAETITFIIASLIVLALIGLVILSWVTQDDRPPILVIDQSEQVREVGGQFYVPFTLTNTGGGTADAVQVLGELRVGDEIETGEQQIDFLSSGEQEEGAFVFSRNPDSGKLTLRVASYKLP